MQQTKFDFVFSHLILAERDCDVEKEHPQGIAGAKKHEEVKENPTASLTRSAGHS